MKDREKKWHKETFNQERQLLIDVGQQPEWGKRNTVAAVGGASLGSRLQMRPEIYQQGTPKALQPMGESETKPILRYQIDSSRRKSPQGEDLLM